jgi:hypothetical protein
LTLVAKRTTLTPFLIAERAVISLYDGGVLSPAVLERVIGAFAQAGVDWQTAPTSRAVDGRSMHEIVVSTMMPGAVPESALASFMTIVEHIGKGQAATKQATDEDASQHEPRRNTRKKRDAPDEDNEADGGELLAQLAGSAQPATRVRPDSPKRPAKSAGFNPFLNAAVPRRK